MAVPKGRRTRDGRNGGNDAYEVGVQGRKTGITIPQGARDEHGIEDLDGIFSSPEKPPPQRSPRKNGDSGRTISSSEDMVLAQSASRMSGARDSHADGGEGSAPEPTEVLSTRRMTLKSTRTTLPPPMGRSPYKTNIGSSPRRQSSVKPRRQASDTPELLEPRPTVTRRLDFTDDSMQSSLRKPAKRKSTAKKDIYTLEATTEEESDGRYMTEEADLPEESMQFVEDVAYDAPAMDEPSEIEQISSPSRRRVSDRQSQLYDEPVLSIKKGKGRPPGRRSLNELEEEEIPAQSSRAAQKAPPRRGGKAQLRVTKQPEPVEESEIMDDSAVDVSFAKPAPKNKGKGRTRQLPTPEDTQPHPDDPVETTELDESSIDPAPKPKAKSKASSKRKMPVYEESEIPDTQEATEIERPSKRTKAAPAKKAAATKKSSAKAPKERNPNIPSSSAPAFKKPGLPPPPTNSTGSRWDESMWANSRNMSRLRDPTPSAEAMVGRTRSGRQVIKPLNHFANERAQYGRDGTLLAVQTAETVEKELPTRSQSRAPRAQSRAASRRRPAQETIYEEDEEAEDPDMEDWEANGEMIHGEVNQYDALTGQTLAETFETELAWSSTSIPLMPVSSANFGFAKLLSMPYFGSGIMDFPVGGFKKPRNSGKTSLHVFVHTGRVYVKIGGVGKFSTGRGGALEGTEFNVGVGGSFHVPRGNLYEIRNIANVNSRLFFAQGTEMVVSD